MPCRLLCLAAVGLRLAQGEVSFGRQHVIDTATGVETSLVAADVNNDGYLDVIPTHADDFPEFAWYGNLKDGHISSTKRAVGEGEHQFVVVADLNQDGIADILASSYVVETSLRWYPGQGDGVFGPAVIIRDSPADHTSLDVGDLDGDGHPDIVAGSAHSGLIQWYRNQGDGTFDDAREVGSDPVQSWYVAKVFAVDLTGDAMVDVLEVSMGAGSNKISLYTNLGDGSWSHERRIALPNPSFFISACVDDLNGDGFHDIIYAGAYIVRWFKNNGDGTFAEAESITSSMSGLYGASISAGDLDGDGDKDLLVSAGNAIHGFENDGQGVFSNLGVVAQGSLPRIVDLTNDGKMDVLAVSDGSIVWYENQHTGRSVDDDLDSSTTASSTTASSTTASSTTTLTSGSVTESSTTTLTSGTVSSVTESSTTTLTSGTVSSLTESSTTTLTSGTVSSVTESSTTTLTSGTVSSVTESSTTTLTSGTVSSVTESSPVATTVADASSTDGSASGSFSSVTESSPVETTTAHLRGTSTAADASGTDGSGSGSVSSVTESRPVEIPAGATASTSPKVDRVVSSTWDPGPIISNNGQARSPAIASLGFAAFMASVAF